MARERIYIYDTTLRDGQQTHTARPQPRSVRGRAKPKTGVCCTVLMAGDE
ncbi:2-isopropylmalate synthase [Ochrobactrum quorumnocens]|uniref:2-isopropylmalate synthase n=1 Tax=Ochrobactrum quorumnocens TaxID=271865 RepID=A0A5N1K2Z9_9HYPH|nr:2-isopropylmalate synthase [[Ochrobactrum] quorumnocens]KAA9370676.1 2-isopropylmalate synthase [[Ochrobactrum] quorumnocens]